MLTWIFISYGCRCQRCNFARAAWTWLFQNWNTVPVAQLAPHFGSARNVNLEIGDGGVAGPHYV